jgi:hypothetical protein
MTRDIAGLLDWHLRHYPLLRAEDIYKLLHQGVFGPGHLIPDPDAARGALEAEFFEVRKRCCMQATGLVEPLDPEESVVRVNLEPLRDVPDASDLLLTTMLASASKISGSPDEMRARLDAALRWCQARLPDQHAALTELSRAAAEDNYQPHHHSRIYETAYRPAYRVVSAGLWRQVEPPAAGDGTCSPPPDGTTA